MFVDNLLTRSVYHISDPNVRKSISSYYNNATTSSDPFLYANITGGVPTTVSSNASYVVSLYQGSTRSIVDSVRITPLEMSVANDLVVPNSIYFGPSKAYKLSFDMGSTPAIIFQCKSSSTNTYQTLFKILVTP